MKKRILTLLLAGSLLIGNILPVMENHVYAMDSHAYEGETEQADEEDYGYVTESQVNPLYEDVLSEEELYQGSESDISLYEVPQYERNEADVIATLQQAMMNRETDVTVYYASVEGYDKKRMERWIEQAFADNGMPDGGDYLRWSYGGYTAGISYFYDENSKVYYYTYDVYLTYYTTYEQEQKLGTKIDSELQKMGAYSPENDDYAKVKLIYDYICTHVTYDHEHLNDQDYKLQYTAYAAMIQNTAVCQGYATLLYRMLKTAGIDTRIITGTGNSGAHAWNIIRLGEKYYQVDATWDSSWNSSYRYFLKGTSDFSSHTALDGIIAGYPVPNSGYAVTGMTITSQNDEMKVGESQILNLSYEPQGYVNDESVIWSSSDEEVIKVDQTGTVRAVGAGSATITVETMGRRAVYEVRVEGNGEYIETGWKQDSTGFTYIREDGTSPKAGWTVIDGNWYYFDANGYRLSNKWIGSYFVKEDGTMATSEWVDNGKYYVNTEGIYQTGWLRLDGKWYYLNGSGAKQTGWISVGGIWYYGVPGTGELLEQEWLDNTYYFHVGGSMAKGWVTIDGNYYYFYSNGVHVTNAWIGSYYLKADGRMATSEWVDSGRYYVNAAGIYQTGWLRLNEKWYYLNGSGAKQTGWICVGGIWYYGEPENGALLEQEWLDNTYYFNAGGSMAKGWVKINGVYYYFYSNGAKASNAWVGNYYLKADGTMAADEWVDGGKYYVDENGVWVANKAK